MGYAIPAPKDDVEAKAWGRRVAARQERLFREGTQRLLDAQDLILIPLAD